MKKILGILGITLIMTVSFFNMSSVVNVNQNIDLASIIQNASADSESTVSYAQKISFLAPGEEHYYSFDTKIGKMVYCTHSYMAEITNCFGVGNVSCEEKVETYNDITGCVER